MIIALIQWYRTFVASTAQERLAASGIRATRQRLRVLEALEAEPNDATAQEIFETLRARGDSIGLATVYRTLGLLSSHGVVDALVHRPGEVCYRLCGDGASSSPHVHRVPSGRRGWASVSSIPGSIASAAPTGSLSRGMPSR